VVGAGKKPQSQAIARLGTRTSVFVTTTRRQFTYRWSAPRSPVWQVTLAPVFLGAALLILLLGAVALAFVLAASIVAVLGLTIASFLRSSVARARASQRRMLRRRSLD
jgi:hypothetical protein